MPGKHSEIFISYSWNDEGLNIADDLERCLQEKGFAVMRDNRAIGYKGLIKEYMQRLGRGKCVILVLSDQYFKSPNCMYELLQITQQPDFQKRIFPVVIDGTLFYRPEDRLKYLTYWDEEKTRLQEEIRKIPNLANLHGITNDLDLYDDIRRNIARLLDFLRNLNTYPLQGGNYEPLLKAIQANMPRAELDYSKLPIDFSSKIEFLTQYFVGRQDAMARIDQFIQTHRSGYLAIVGEAGIGKSALLAHEVKKRSAVHHFVDDKQNSAKDEVFLRSIVGQLQQQYGFEFEERTPISVSEWNMYFQKWIKEVSAEEQLIIFVDALDEAQHYGGSDNLLKYLPPELPENVYFILSSRPEFKKENITFFNSTVFETYDLAPLTQADIETYLVQRNISKQTSEIATIIWEKSEGNPLYLYYLFQDIDSKNLTLEQINQLPQGLMKFYEKQWCERIYIGDKVTKEGRKQILCLQLILKEPPNEDMLLELTDFDRDELQDYLTPLRQFMSTGEKYALFHDSFKNFLQHLFEKELPKFHESLIERLWQWRELNNEALSYALLWLPNHLKQTKQLETLKSLLLDLNFIEEKVNFFPFNEVFRDFALLPQKDDKIRLLERLLWLQFSVFHSTRRQYFLTELFSRLAESDQLQRELLDAEFETAFEQSRLLPVIWLKQTNVCPDRLDETFLSAFKGHPYIVWSVAYAPDGKIIASSDDAGVIKLSEVETGTEIRNLIGHTHRVFSVQFSSDGQFLGSGSADKTVKIWEVATGKAVLTLEGHEAMVTSVAFLPDNQHIASASVDRTIKLWELATGQEVHSFQGHTGTVVSIAVAPDGLYLASGSVDQTIRLWDVKTGKEFNCFVWDDPIHCVKFSPDGTKLASADDDGKITLWEVETGKQIETLKDYHGSSRKALCISDDWAAWGVSIDFSPDGTWIVSSGNDYVIKLWNIEDSIKRVLSILNLVHTITSLWRKNFEFERCSQILYGHTDNVTSVAFSPDGKQIISGSYDTTIRLWEIHLTHVTEIREFAEMGTNTAWKIKLGDIGSVKSIAFSYDGMQVVSVHRDKNSIRRWKVATGKPIYVSNTSAFDLLIGPHHYIPPEAYYCANFHPNNKQIIGASEEGQKINIFKVKTGNNSKTLFGCRNAINAIAVSFDGKYVAVGSDDKTIKFWKLKFLDRLKFGLQLLHSIIVQLQEGFSPKLIHNVVSFLEDNTGLSHLFFCAILFLLISITQKVIPGYGFSLCFNFLLLVTAFIFWLGSSGRTLYGHSAAVLAIAFSPQGHQLISGSKDHTLKLWDVRQAKELRTFTGHVDAVLAVTFSADGAHVVSGSQDTTIKLWDVATGEEIRTFTGHEAGVLSLSISPDGKWIVSGSEDQTIKLWKVETGEEILTFWGHAPILKVQFSPDGKEIWAVDTNPAPRIYRFEIVKQR